MPTYHRNHVFALMRRAGHFAEIATANQALPDIVDPERGRDAARKPGPYRGRLDGRHRQQPVNTDAPGGRGRQRVRRILRRPHD